MNDDKTGYNWSGEQRIDLTDPKAVKDWAKLIGATPEQVKSAVRRVGPSVHKVRDYLWELGD